MTEPSATHDLYSHIWIGCRSPDRLRSVTYRFGPAVAVVDSTPHAARARHDASFASATVGDSPRCAFLANARHQRIFGRPRFGGAIER